MLTRFSNHLLSQDIEAVVNARFNRFYREVSSLTGDAPIMALNVDIKLIRIFIQLRLINDKYPRLFINGNAHKFEPDKACPSCTMKTDTLTHFFFRMSNFQLC
ncbi:hypothetical protein O3M35_012060 [Rhynocoris fuscipes]|uniref:Uncharacterized protein n=1 Tax=Rhynocoris fuscipes TaxID=488301 RepID=A0AAW1CYF9_9HEMI